MNRCLILILILLALSLPAVAQDSPPPPAPQESRGGVRVGLLAGGYWLTRSGTQDFFGDVWPNVDLALYWPKQYQSGGFTADISLRWGDDNAEATLVPLTIGWWEDLDDLFEDEEPKSWRSYAAARFGPYYGRVKGILDEETTIGLNGHLVLGAVFGRRFIAELRYDWYTEIADINFEGLTFQIGFLLGR